MSKNKYEDEELELKNKIEIEDLGDLEDFDSEEEAVKTESKESEPSKAKNKKNNNKRNKEEEKPSVFREVMSWIIPFVIAIAVVLLLKTFVIINANVPSGSMQNTIMDGDNLIGLRLAYKFSEPQRGDVVIFPAPDKENEKYIKRIVGLPGETVTIQNGQVYIDGVLLEEDYVKEDWSQWDAAYEDPGTVHTYVVPEGCYFMMGDNRNNSSDARFWKTIDPATGEIYAGNEEYTNPHLGSDSDPLKFVKGEDIIGKALFVYWPLDHFGGL